jgi:SAM-dependent methyltransferase
MRDYKFIDQYLNNLLGDLYAQPSDEGHTLLAQEVIDLWGNRLTTCHNVLDAGCGQGFCQPMFERHGLEYTGVCLGNDYDEAKKLGYNVRKMDFSFLEFPDESFDLIFSRHSLEHSPMPMLTLMEWARVSKNWLGLIIPAPEHWTYKGLNHYAVMGREQILAILPRAGWNVMWDDIKYWENGSTPNEYWVFAERIRK